jgi:hypothetical protein
MFAIIMATLLQSRIVKSGLMPMMLNLFWEVRRLKLITEGQPTRSWKTCLPSGALTP